MYELRSDVLHGSDLLQLDQDLAFGWGVLLSSIIVHKDDGKPGNRFLPYARSQGFDKPLPTLQRQVFDHFATTA